MNERHTLIKLDVDVQNFEQMKANLKEIYWVMDTLNLTIVKMNTWNTKRGYHRIIEIEEQLQPLEIVLVQALCGSDLRREAFNMARVLKLSDAPLFWQSRWNNLYSEKLTKEEVI